jgi:hypothetical protein
MRATRLFPFFGVPIDPSVLGRKQSEQVGIGEGIRCDRVLVEGIREYPRPDSNE